MAYHNQHISRHKQKKLLRLVVHKAVLTEDTVKIALYGRHPEIGPILKPAEARCQMGEWLPGQMSESVVLWDMTCLLTPQATSASRDHTARNETNVTEGPHRQSGSSEFILQVMTRLAQVIPRFLSNAPDLLH
jgi:hypothetical protein